MRKVSRDSLRCGVQCCRVLFLAVPNQTPCHWHKQVPGVTGSHRCLSNLAARAQPLVLAAPALPKLRQSLEEKDHFMLPCFLLVSAVYKPSLCRHIWSFLPCSRVLLMYCVCCLLRCVEYLSQMSFILSSDWNKNEGLLEREKRFASLPASLHRRLR